MGRSTCGSVVQSCRPTTAPKMRSKEKTIVLKTTERLLTERKQRKNKKSFVDDDKEEICTDYAAAIKALCSGLGLNEFEVLLDELVEKKGPKREETLTAILHHFNNNSYHKFLENNTITLLHRCLNCLVKGSNKEAILVSRIIGLLSLSVGCENRAYEIYTDSVSKFSQVLLKPVSDSAVLCSLLDCLAIVTFVGVTDPDETQVSMQLIWELLQTSGVQKVEVQISAILAWSFLLATIHPWRIDPKLWKDSISYFSNLLEDSNQSVRILAGETLAHLLEIGSLDRFSNEATDMENSQKVKESILEQVDCKCPKRTVKIGEDELQISQWSQLIQVKFLKRYSGCEFVGHVKQNELYQDFFDFTPPTRKLASDNLYISETEKEVRYVYTYEMHHKDPLYKRVCVSSSSVINKAKTQLMNKKRDLVQAEHAGCFSVSFCNEE